MRRPKYSWPSLISIHAPHARSDFGFPASAAGRIFQSTLLMRGATCALLATRPTASNFNPRSSCEERLFLGNEGLSIVEFQSTLLMRGATQQI